MARDSFSMRLQCSAAPAVADRSAEGDSAVFRAWTLVLSVVLSAIAIGAAAADKGAAQVTDERLLNAAAEPSQWMTYGGSYSEQRFSPLKQINTDNVKQLGLAWFADYDTNLHQHGSPLYIDGVIYVSTAWNKVYAFDAKTGKQLWQYNPKMPGEWIANVCCGIVNRGIAAYNGKIYHRHARWPPGRDRREDRQGSVVDRSTVDKIRSTTRSRARRASRRARCSSAAPAASSACAAASRLRRRDRQAATGASTPCPATRRRASRTSAGEGREHLERRLVEARRRRHRVGCHRL